MGLKTAKIFVPFSLLRCISVASGSCPTHANFY